MEIGSDTGDPIEGNPKSFDTWKLRTVMQHNYYRTRYGANQLVWSDALYPATQQWANQCQFRHSGSGGTYGENLAAGYGEYGFSTGLRDWMKEACAYPPNPTFSPATGHFTQLVWKSTGEVACAMAHCESGTIFPQSSKFIVCRYSPPGNYLGRFSENVGRPVPS
ncbi:CAP domain-containing protein [Infundibulicybe gibba]|nr:CAP domain-containing protein [Infundibulicybe gibba]